MRLVLPVLNIMKERVTMSPLFLYSQFFRQFMF